MSELDGIFAGLGGPGAGAARGTAANNKKSAKENAVENKATKKSSAQDPTSSSRSKRPREEDSKTSKKARTNSSLKKDSTTADGHKASKNRAEKEKGSTKATVAAAATADATKKARVPVVVHDTSSAPKAKQQAPPPDDEFGDSRGEQCFSHRTPLMSTRDQLKAQLALGPSSCREEIAKDFFKVRNALEGEHLAVTQMMPEPTKGFKPIMGSAPSPNLFRINLVRTGLQSRVIGYREVASRKLKNNSSLSRPAGGISDFVHGSTSNTPFHPGGMDDYEEAPLRRKPPRHRRVIPPGFESGLFHSKKEGTEGKEFVPPGDESDEELAEDDKVLADELDGDTNEPDNLRITAKDLLYKMTDNPPARQESDAILDKILPQDLKSTDFLDGVVDVPESKRTWAHVINASLQMSNFHELVPTMAIEYPFELDTFQKQAIYHLEQSDSVFVAAHTSAGKTVVAEYAIALSRKHLARCIYTSPIKALSNQKFREFKQRFGASNVGILTGDVQINPEAPCLIMTTEILRSMLYRSADLIRDVEFVVFDEVHYVNDQERGVVWEEVIILLPTHVNVVLLSATVPNYKEFAEWVGRTKKKDVYVVSTTKRPIPLEHFLYAGNDIIRIVDERGMFITQGVQKANEALTRKQDRDAPPSLRGGTRGSSRGAGRGAQGGTRGGTRGSARGGSRGGMAPRRTDVTRDKSLWVHIIAMLKKKSLLPVVVFVFSKRKCEEYTDSLSNTDLTNAHEKSEVHLIMARSLTRLNDSDRKLPQIVRIRDMLLRGIGIHHSGLLPIMKEVVEIMFQRGLVKVLFATETFAMGVNMPARSVVFSSIRKHDGRGMRYLLPGEYTQMSGRAGRRGLDKTGVVIVVASDETSETHVLNRMILGQSTKLNSQFRVTYSMILNMLRSETMRVEDMIKRSFSENSTQTLLPAQEEQLNKLLEEIERHKNILQRSKLGADALETFHDASFDAVRHSSSVIALAYHNAQGRRQFSPGRFVFLQDNNHFWAPAIIVSSQNASRFTLLVGIVENENADYNIRGPMWLTARRAQNYTPASITMAIQQLPLSSIIFVSKHVVDVDESKIQSKSAGAARPVLDGMKRIVTAIKEDIMSGEESAQKLLSHEADWGRIHRLDFSEAMMERNTAIEVIAETQSISEHPDFVQEYNTVTHIRRLERESERIRYSMSEQNLELLPDYHQRMEVLRDLRFVDPATDSVLVKGRVACEIKSVAELVLSDLVLDSTFIDYEPEVIVAMISTVVFREKSQVTPKLNEQLSKGIARIAESVEYISTVQNAHQVPFDEEAEGVRTGLAEVVYEWALGTEFSKIMELTDVGEGTIVRTITRIDETLRNLCDAARVAGDMELLGKMQHTQALIHRDIIFAASLYF
ncbi:Antiviral helicase ski2 [Malassezia cuniculi]|uniref:Antiviral helicase ski2 n=1 Tax=Malassezia cuniculi TaxID=948313 RepID=A0AAF0EY17_9BASI|nr:Antiviral helicase ski2 [Malassezia cuniculi]